MDTDAMRRAMVESGMPHADLAEETGPKWDTDQMLAETAVVAAAMRAGAAVTHASHLFKQA